MQPYSAFEKGGEWQRALSLFEAMPKVQVNPNVISYSAAICACEKGTQWQQALNLFTEMLPSKLVPNSVTYNALFDCAEIYSSENLGGRFFQDGLLPILNISSVFQDLEVDLHQHSEGAARLTLQWWLSTMVAQHLKGSGNWTDSISINNICIYIYTHTYVCVCFVWASTCPKQMPRIYSLVGCNKEQ